MSPTRPARLAGVPPVLPPAAMLPAAVDGDRRPRSRWDGRSADGRTPREGRPRAWPASAPRAAGAPARRRGTTGRLARGPRSHAKRCAPSPTSSTCSLRSTSRARRIGFFTCVHAGDAADVEVATVHQRRVHLDAPLAVEHAAEPGVERGVVLERTRWRPGPRRARCRCRGGSPTRPRWRGAPRRGGPSTRRRGSPTPPRGRRGQGGADGACPFLHDSPARRGWPGRPPGETRRARPWYRGVVTRSGRGRRRAGHLPGARGRPRRLRPPRRPVRPPPPRPRAAHAARSVRGRRRRPARLPQRVPRARPATTRSAPSATGSCASRATCAAIASWRAATSRARGVATRTRTACLASTRPRDPTHGPATTIAGRRAACALPSTPSPTSTGSPSSCATPRASPSRRSPQITGEPMGTVKTHLHRARAALARELAEPARGRASGRAASRRPPPRQLLTPPPPPPTSSPRPRRPRSPKPPVPSRYEPRDGPSIRRSPTTCLSACAAGELSPAEADAVRARAASDPALAARLAAAERVERPLRADDLLPVPLALLSVGDRARPRRACAGDRVRTRRGARTRVEASLAPRASAIAARGASPHCGSVAADRCVVALGLWAATSGFEPAVARSASPEPAAVAVASALCALAAAGRPPPAPRHVRRGGRVGRFAPRARLDGGPSVLWIATLGSWAGSRCSPPRACSPAASAPSSTRPRRSPHGALARSLVARGPPLPHRHAPVPRRPRAARHPVTATRRLRLRLLRVPCWPSRSRARSHARLLARDARARRPSPRRRPPPTAGQPSRPLASRVDRARRARGPRSGSSGMGCAVRGARRRVPVAAPAVDRQARLGSSAAQGLLGSLAVAGVLLAIAGVARLGSPMVDGIVGPRAGRAGAAARDRGVARHGAAARGEAAGGAGGRAAPLAAVRIVGSVALALAFVPGLAFRFYPLALLLGVPLLGWPLGVAVAAWLARGRRRRRRRPPRDGAAARPPGGSTGADGEGACGRGGPGARLDRHGRRGTARRATAGRAGPTGPGRIGPRAASPAEPRLSGAAGRRSALLTFVAGLAEAGAADGAAERLAEHLGDHRPGIGRAGLRPRARRPLHDLPPREGVPHPGPVLPPGGGGGRVRAAAEPRRPHPARGHAVGGRPRRHGARVAGRAAERARPAGDGGAADRARCSCRSARAARRWASRGCACRSTRRAEVEEAAAEAALPDGVALGVGDVARRGAPPVRAAAARERPRPQGERDPQPRPPAPAGGRRHPAHVRLAPRHAVHGGPPHAAHPAEGPVVALPARRQPRDEHRHRPGHRRARGPQRPHGARRRRLARVRLPQLVGRHEERGGGPGADRRASSRPCSTSSPTSWARSARPT